MKKTIEQNSPDKLNENPVEGHNWSDPAIRNRDLIRVGVTLVVVILVLIVVLMLT